MTDSEPDLSAACDAAAAARPHGTIEVTLTPRPTQARPIDEGENTMAENTKAEHTRPSSEYVKCDGKGIICTALRRRLEDGHRRGLNSLLMVDEKTFEEAAPLLVYKSSKKETGIVLNFCPFCGAELNLCYRKPAAASGPNAASGGGDSLC